MQGFDRSLRRDGENLLASLIQFGLTLRQAEYAATYDPSAPARKKDSRVEQTAAIAAELRLKLSNALEEAALEEYQNAASSYLGLPSQPSSDISFSAFPIRSSS